ncbi:MAG TPA: Cof-type HAD-IIB family hydrolase [Symbiobacteriaceae bacterium]
MNGYRLLALDIDGTLLNPAGELTPRVQNAVTGVMRAGMLVTLATGRNLRSTLPIARALGITAPLVVSNGSLVICPVTSRVLLYRPLDPEVAKQTVQLLERAGLAACATRVCLSGPDFFYAQSPSYFAFDLRRGRPPESVQKVADLAAVAARIRPLKVMALDSTDAVAAAARELERQFAGRCRVLITPEGEGCALLEVSAPGVTKATGLERLAALYRICPEEMIAIGDNRNDLEMLRYAGLGVAMGNADDEVKQAARVVTAPNDADGVAVFLESFILQGASSRSVPEPTATRS